MHVLAYLMLSLYLGLCFVIHSLFLKSMLVDTVEIDSFHYWDHVSVFFLLAHGWALDNNWGPESAARREGVSWL